ncbi:MAG TPA: hypothetical protein ENL26_00535 [Kosmotoga arenicorallina]|uniref:CopG family transcriptional regulator n=1 Tax=Kosmotoga arenicorallina TaxID=688066 RepID=A0A7C5HNT8_9BACT|nr:hypothetical protein [Kosmotoga arenicorallina]
MEGKKVVITLNEEQAELLNSVKGRGFGTKDAEIIKNIFIAYLSEKLSLKIKSKYRREQKGEGVDGEEEKYDETFWARQRELLKEREKFVSIDEI